MLSLIKEPSILHLLFISRCQRAVSSSTEIPRPIWSCFSPTSCYSTLYPCWYPWFYTLWLARCFYLKAKVNFPAVVPEIPFRHRQHKRPTSLAFRFVSELFHFSNSHIILLSAFICSKVCFLWCLWHNHTKLSKLLRNLLKFNIFKLAYVDQLLSSDRDFSNPFLSLVCISVRAL